MKCPVCKTDIDINTRVCPMCGFNKLHIEFLTPADAVNWVEQVVLPYRENWQKSSLNADNLFETLMERQFSKITATASSKSDPFEYLIDEHGAVITRYSGSNEALQIPSSYKDVPVYKIADGVFQNCLDLKFVELPIHLHVIGQKAFAGSSIVGIDFNDELVEICDGAFENTDLGEVVIPDSVKRIGASSFRYSKLSNFNFDFFSNAPSKKECTTNIKLGRNVEYIGDYAFSRTATEKIVFPETLKTIPKDICFLCSDLTTVVILGATKICSGAFQNCSQLTNVILPENAEVIDEYAFAGCENLNRMIIPENVVQLASNAVFFGGFSKSSEPKKIAFLSNDLRIITITKNDPIMKRYGVRESFDPQSVVFYCNAGSTAQKYARDNSIRSRPLSEFVDG